MLSFRYRLSFGLVLSLSLAACADPSRIDPRDLQQSSTSTGAPNASTTDGSTTTTGTTGTTSPADTSGIVNPPANPGTTTTTTSGGGGSTTTTTFDATAQSVFRSLNADYGDYLFTLQQGEGSDAGYADQGAKFKLLSNPSSTRSVVYRCVNGATDHFLSLDGNCEGQSLDGPLGYVESQSAGTANSPLYRCANGSTHMASKRQTECSNLGFTVEMVLGYTL